MNAHNLHEEVFPRTMPNIGPSVEVARQHPKGTLAWQIEEIVASLHERLELGDADVEVVPVRLKTASAGGQ